MPITDRFHKVENPIWFKNEDEVTALATRSVGGGLPWHFKALSLDYDPNYGNNTSVALVDTGVNINHKSFKGAFIEPLGFNRMKSYSYGEHGTATASLLIGNGFNNIHGLSPKTKLFAMQALSKDGIGNMHKVISSVKEARKLKVDVINLSLGSYKPNRKLMREIDKALGDGIIVVAAGGNNGRGSGVMYPALHPGVLAVGAVNELLELCGFSSTGELGDIDVVAPGARIRVATNRRGAGKMSGTSFASPLVTGIILRAKSMGIPVTKDLIMQTSFDLARPGEDRGTGWGLVDFEALKDGSL